MNIQVCLQCPVRELWNSNTTANISLFIVCNPSLITSVNATLNLCLAYIYITVHVSIENMVFRGQTEINQDHGQQS